MSINNKFENFFDGIFDGVDELDYSITKDKDIYKARLKVLINDHSYDIYKRSDNLDHLVFKLKNTLYSLGVKKSKRIKMSA